MVDRWRGRAAFRANPVAAATARPSRRQSLALVVVFALVAAGVTAAGLLVRPDDARSFDLFDGSVLLADAVAPVAVDLASGRPTVRLADASAQVGAERAGDVSVVPMAGGTLLLDRRTGQFNLVDATGFVVKKNGGVPLPQRAGESTAFARAAGGLAYVVRTGSAGSSVYLVGPGTVQGAADGTTVRPRAFSAMSAQIQEASSVTAGGDLWTLVGTGSERTARRLALPADSAPGVRLRQTDVGQVDGPAAIGAAGRTVAVASNGRLQLRRGDAVVRTLTVPTVDGLDAILPASNATSRLAFLLHGSNGWRLLSVSRDGRDRRGPTLLPGIAANARLVAPATGEGALYTADATTGALWRIDLGGSADPVPDVASYPVATQNGRPIEAAGFEDTAVYARGPRVVINSPNHLRAVVLFTDGSRAPVVFTKSDATTISSGGGAEALARSRNRGANQPAPTRGRPTPRPVSPINNQVDCTATSQTPHIPIFGTPVPGSRSVQLSWTYPVVDRTDCIPRTYTVGVRLLSTAPEPPSRVTVDGQLGVNLGGLYPSSRYELRVTAYLNGKGTSSAPIRITTGPAGPSTPVGVTARVDPGGTWDVAWRSCGTATSRCVTATSWRVIPQLCDGQGLAGAPAAAEVVADPTSAVQTGTQIVGGDALLGRGLRFQVEGIGADGTVGEPSPPTACTTSWGPPDATALRLSASSPADVAVGTTTTTTLSLNLGGNAVRAVGGVGATVVYSLTGPGGTQTTSATVDGRASVVTQSFDGVRAGATYTASARISPPGHPEAAVTITADSITTRAQWPALSLAASCAPDSAVSCDLTARIGGISTDATGGERFVLTDGSILKCDNASAPVTDLDQSSWTVTKTNVAQTSQLYGTCKLTVVLAEAGGNPSPLFFGGVTASVTTDVDLGAPASANAQPGDFTAAWSDQGGASAKVTYTGGRPIGLLTRGWTSTLVAPGGSTCGSGPDNAPPTPVYVPAGACVQSYGDQTAGWHVVLTYSDTTDGDQHRVDVPLDPGAPPGYQACTPTGFSASWGDLRATGVGVGLGGGDVAGCGNWAYDLQSSVPSPCGTASGAPPQTIEINCGDPADDGWHVTIRWTTSAGSPATATVPVTGTPPTT